MRILFCRSRTVISWLIRLLTWSDWSHVVIVGPDGVNTVEADWPKVYIGTLIDARRTNDIVEEREFPCANPQAAWEWALAQAGKRYDWTALAGFLAHRDWAYPDRWFCSELAAAALQEGGSPRFREDSIDRVTPQMLWILHG